MTTPTFQLSPADVAARFDHLVGRFAPQVTSISLGTNDANAGAPGSDRFRRELAGPVARSADLGATVVVHTPVLTSPTPWMDDHARPNAVGHAGWPTPRCAHSGSASSASTDHGAPGTS